DVFGILSNAGATQRDAENPSLVTCDQDFKRLGISAFSGGNQSSLILSRENVDWRDRWCSFVELSYECGHSVPPGPPAKSEVLVFDPWFGFKRALNSCFAFILPSSGFAWVEGEQAMTLARKPTNKPSTQWNGPRLVLVFS
ncbi:MAG TPA: hypothetical protein VNO32_62770, partial [Candidatus Acidoferrum sp.]|nr:hypothetical protein [Candidatus Acidoferrum sp.]